VLPVGGIKEKVIAAAQIKRVLLPARNKRDFEDIPEEVRKQLDFVWIENVDEAERRSIRSRTRICPNRGRPRCDCVGGPSSARRPGSMSRMF
jgi:ATP-dependent Lon protease